MRRTYTDAGEGGNKKTPQPKPRGRTSVPASV